MSAVEKFYKVEYAGTGSTPLDITDFVISLDNFVLQSTGKMSQAKFTINAEFGSFITNDGGGATPIISQYDKVRITTIGDDGVTEKSRIFEITTDLAQLSTTSSNFLPLEAEGRERNLAGIPFGGFFRSGTHFNLAKDIVLAYLRQAKIPPNPVTGQQPIISLIDSNNALPEFNPNIWDFTQVDNCYDGLLSIVDNADLPVSAGGGGKRFALIFEDDDTFPFQQLNVKIIVQGTNNPGAIPTLEQNDEHPIVKIAKIKVPPTGSMVIARGRNKTGTMPANFSKFISRLEFYNNILPWDSTLAYPEDANTQLNDIKYVANDDTLAGDTPGVSAKWTALDVGDYVDQGGSPFIYSPFTKNRLQEIKNGFANPTGGFDTSDFDSIAIPDHNLVINDRNTTANKGTYRNWVLIRSNTDAITGDAYLNKWLFEQDDFYHGFTMLVDSSLGALSSTFSGDNHNTGAGNDPNGQPYSDSMVVYIVPDNQTFANGTWYVTKVALAFDECAVYSLGRVFEYNVPPGAGRVYPGNDRRRGGNPVGVDFAWRDISDKFIGNDCFHVPSSITQVDGLFADKVQNTEPLDDSSGFPYIQNSGIRIEFGYGQADETQENREVWFNLVKQIFVENTLANFIGSLSGSLYNTYLTPQYTNLGWWFAWASPFQLSNHVNSATKEIGNIYGGDSNTINRHRYFDLFNIRYTTSGKEGWIHEDSEDLSEITGVEFLFNYDITIGGNRIPFTGDIPFSYWCIDSEGTVWKSQKKMYRHLGETQPIKIEFGDLTPAFRGRTPLGIDNVLENIIVGEIEVNELFFKDRIVMQGFQCETPYDKDGRYSPNLWEQIIKPTFFDAFNGGGIAPEAVKFIGIIDAFNFIKTPVAISKPTVFSETRTITPNFAEYQNIVNLEQLQRFADSQAEVEAFPYEQYTVPQGGINDLNLEDSVYLKAPFLIKESDKPVSALDAWNNSTEYLADADVIHSGLGYRALVDNTNKLPDSNPTFWSVFGSISVPNTRLLTLREIHYSVPKGEGMKRTGVFVKVIDT